MKHTGRWLRTVFRHYWTRQIAVLRSPYTLLLALPLYMLIALAASVDTEEAQPSVYSHATWPSSPAEWSAFGFDVASQSGLLIVAAVLCAVLARGAGVAGNRRQWMGLPHAELPLSLRTRVPVEFTTGLVTLSLLYPVLWLYARALWWSSFRSAWRYYYDVELLSPLRRMEMGDLSASIEVLPDVLAAASVRVEWAAPYCPLVLAVMFGLPQSIVGTATRLIPPLFAVWIAHWYGVLNDPAVRWTIGVLFGAGIIAQGPARVRSLPFKLPKTGPPSLPLFRQSRSGPYLLRHTGLRAYMYVVGIGLLVLAVTTPLCFLVWKLAGIRDPGLIRLVPQLTVFGIIVAPLVGPLGLRPSSMASKRVVLGYDGSLAGIWGTLPVVRMDVVRAHFVYCFPACALIILALDWDHIQELTLNRGAHLLAAALVSSISFTLLAVGMPAQRRRTIFWVCVIFGSLIMAPGIPLYLNYTFARGTWIQWWWYPFVRFAIFEAFFLTALVSIALDMLWPRRKQGPLAGT